MKTKEQILSSITGMTVNDDMEIMQTKVSYILNAMEEYAGEQVKNLSLPDIRLSLLVDKAEEEATERYAHIQGVDYGNGLEHGFVSGAEWVVEKLKGNEA